MEDFSKLHTLTKNLSILYVEDDKDCQEETWEILEYFFDKIDTAFDGEEGLKKYNTYFDNYLKYYDIVITDINMPKMDGVTLSKNIYLKNPNQSIIVISAHDESHYLIELINMGVEQFLMKPLDYDKILKVIHNTSTKISDVKKKEELDTANIELDNDFNWCKTNSQLFFNNELVKLTKNETLLISLFIKNGNKISANEEIFNTIWSKEPHLASHEALSSIISRFRKKHSLEIENIYGLGYRLIF